MTRVSDTFLASVVFFYRSEEEANKAVGPGGGSGFILGVKYAVPVRRWHYYLVTNKHVINHEALVARVKVGYAGAEIWPTVDEAWEKHPHADLALCAFDPPEEWNFACIDSGSLLTSEQEREWGIGVGDETFVAARLVGFEGRLWNQPVLHTGVISMMRGDPVLNPETKQEERGYLIESHSRSGFSGSPVFGWISPKQVQLGGPDRSGLGEIGYLLGVLWGYLYEPRPILAKDGKPIRTADGIPTKAYVDFPRGLAGVVPAVDLMRLLNLRRFMDKRIDDENDWAGRHPDPETRVGPAFEEPEDTIDKTTGLMGKPLKRPKEDADEVHRNHPT